MGRRSACSMAMAAATVLGISCASTAGAPAASAKAISRVVRISVLLFRFEFQGHAVHAVTLAGGVRSIREHMPQMSAAAGAMHFGPRHSEAAVSGGAHGPGQGREKTRPTRAAVEFRG